MTVAESERMFREEAYQGEAVSRQQAARGTFDPGYLSYTMGKLMIRKLTVVGRVARREGTWKQFHDKFLSLRQSAGSTRATRDDGCAEGIGRALLSGASTRADWRVPVARWLAPVLLGMVAFALVLDITEPPSPGLDPDALAYVGSADRSRCTASSGRRPRTGRAATAPRPSRISHPDSPRRLRSGAIGDGPLQGARLVEATAAFVTVTTLVFLVGEATAPLAGILLAVALFAMSAMHEVHVSVLSEPLFLAFLALTLAAMVRRDERPWLAGLCAALAAMTRYAGISAIGAVVLWSIARRGTFGERLRRGAWALLPAAVLARAVVRADEARRHGGADP